MESGTTQQSKPDPISVTGLVTPTAWNELGDVSAVMLEWDAETEDDPGEIRLHPRGAGKSLLEFVGRIVTASGLLELDRDGVAVLRVTSFRLHRTNPVRRLAS